MRFRPSPLPWKHPISPTVSKHTTTTIPPQVKTLYTSRFVMGHEVLGTIVRLGTSFAHTSETNANPHQIGSMAASKGWGAPRAYSDLNIGDKVRSIRISLRHRCLPTSRLSRYSPRAVWNARRALLIDYYQSHHTYIPSECAFVVSPLDVPLPNYSVQPPSRVLKPNTFVSLMQGGHSFPLSHSHLHRRYYRPCRPRTNSDRKPLLYSWPISSQPAILQRNKPGSTRI